MLLAAFANPSVKRLTVTYNYMRTSFTKTLQKLIKFMPEKIGYLNFMGSLNYADHVMPVLGVLGNMKLLMSINFAGLPSTQHVCRELAKFIVGSFQIREIDLSHCRINFQGTRYIIDALNRNVTIRNFNFSHNDLSS